MMLKNPLNLEKRFGITEKEFKDFSSLWYMLYDDDYKVQEEDLQSIKDLFRDINELEIEDYNLMYIFKKKELEGLKIIWEDRFPVRYNITFFYSNNQTKCEHWFSYKGFSISIIREHHTFSAETYKKMLFFWFVFFKTLQKYSK